VALFAGLLLFARILQPTGASAIAVRRPRATSPTSSGWPRSLFTDFLWPFEITSALLVIAVVGAIVLARRGGPGTSLDDDADVDLPVSENGSRPHVGAGSDEGPAAVLEYEA